MSKSTIPVSQYIDTLTENARALLAATSDAAEIKVAEARKRLAEALDGGRDIYDRVKRSASRSARIADERMHENPYAPIGIALVIGVLLAVFLIRPRK